jgi:hypothetical protein
VMCGNCSKGLLYSHIPCTINGHNFMQFSIVSMWIKCWTEIQNQNYVPVKMYLWKPKWKVGETKKVLNWQSVTVIHSRGRYIIHFVIKINKCCLWPESSACWNTAWASKMQCSDPIWGIYIHYSHTKTCDPFYLSYLVTLLRNDGIFIL